MNDDRLVKLIRDISDGKQFIVVFVKRTTGETRRMVCKKGVTDWLAGTDRKIPKGLIGVWDVEKEWYRSIPEEGIISVEVDGIVHQKELV